MARPTLRFPVLAAVLAGAVVVPACGRPDPAATAPPPQPPAAQAAADLGDPPAELFAVLDEDIRRLEAGARDPAEFARRAKPLRTDALAVALFAQVGINESGRAHTKQLATARNGGLGFAAAAGRHADALGHLATAQAFRSATADTQPRSAHIPLNQIITMTGLMEYAGLLNAALTEAELTPADWADDARRGEVVRNAWRMTAVARAITAHTPATDPNPKKGQTRQHWQDAAAETRRGADELLEEARARRGAGYAEKVKALEAACTKCHAAYRVE